MSQRSELTRRQAMSVSLLFPLAAGLELSATAAVAQSASNSRVLVACFTRTGNTRVIARQIRRAFDAQLFEIRPAQDYPEDYDQTVSQATREREAGYEPPLASTVPDFGSYETVFLGFPVWGMDAPAVVRSFLSGHDLSGKTLVPFITHGGYGVGQSLSTVAAHAPRARLVEGFSLQADQERQTLDRVTRWLGTVEVAN